MRGFAQNNSAGCTKSGHRAVNGVHPIENACSYKGVIFVDSENRRSTTGSFFDSFLSFSGWCGVRGSSLVTVLTRKVEMEGGQGSIAKRWLRRTEKKC